MRKEQFIVYRSKGEGKNLKMSKSKLIGKSQGN